MTRIAVLGYRLSGVRSGAHRTHLELGGFLAERGHAVTYAALAGETRTRFGDRVHVGRDHVRDAVAGADWVMVRDEPRVGALLPLVGSRRLLYTCHSPAGDPASLGLRLPANSVLVRVSAALEAQTTHQFGPYRGASTVIEGCPLEAARYRSTPGQSVSLVNLSLRKGGEVFWWLAERMTDVSFLGIEGWGQQILRDPPPANVRLMRRVADPREFYGKTRVLLLPSAETRTVASEELPAWGEAWNRVGVEAALSGIPAIAHPAAGIRASLGDAAVYVDRGDLDGWERAVRRFDDPGYWNDRSRIAQARGNLMASRSTAIIDAYDQLIRMAA
jgi:hypothetical protein